MVKINRHIFLGNATENDVGTAIDAVQILPLIYLGNAEPSPISYIDVLLSGVSPLTLTDALADGLNYLKLFGGTELVPETYLDTVTLGGGTEQRNLPSEYTQVEYLESSGTQYIDTGVVLNSAATIETVAQLNTSSVTGVASFWGFIGPSSGGSVPRWTTGIYGNKWLMDLNTTTQGAYSNADTNKHTFVNSSFYNNSDLYYQSTIDGVNVFQSSQIVVNPESYSTNTLKAYLFARNNGSGVTSYINGKIYQFKITQNDILVINLIPCRRNSDNVLGMYDTVTGNFLTNSGTGTFTAGADTVPTPDAPMNIVCNNGVLKLSPNLFNADVVLGGTIRSEGIDGDPNPARARLEYLYLPTGTYTISNNGNTVNQCLGASYSNDTGSGFSRIDSWTWHDLPFTFTLTSNRYVRFMVRNSSDIELTTDNIGKFQLEQGSTATPYRPYGQIYTDGTVEQVTDSLGNTANAEKLLAVGDYKDTQEVLNGSVTRNVGIKVLDGTESWKKVSAGGTQRFYMTLTNSATTTGRYNVPITHFHFDSSLNDVGVGFLANQILYLYANPDWTEEQFKQWLAEQYSNGTPVIVAYPISSATTESITGQFLSKSPVTQTAGSIDNLPITITESQKTTPTPSQPLQINCNNGVLKYNANIIDNSITGQGTFVSPSSQATRIYKYFGKLQSGNYTLSITGGFQFIAQYRDTDPPAADMAYGNIGTWATSGTYTFDNPDYFYGIAIRYPDNSDITPSDFNGTITLKPQFVYTDGTVETIEITGNLVDFNETRINSSTWDSADKTKGFEVCADVYQKAVGDSMLSNANAFGVFVPCKQGESISLNFFDYEPFYSRCLYCEITADRKCNTTPQAYDNANAIVQKTFTLTQSDSIGFVIEWYISGERVRNYTKENYTVINGQTPPTSYIPYFNGGNASAEMLLKIGDYKDVQSVIDGNVTRNIGVKALDGTEFYVKNDSRYYYTAPNILNEGNVRSTNLLCSHFLASTTGIEGNCFKYSGQIYFYPNMTLCPDTTAFKQFLADQYNAGTPVIVVYPLAEPTTETVTGQPLTVQTGTNIVTITQASIDNLTMELSYKQEV